MVVEQVAMVDSEAQAIFQELATRTQATTTELQLAVQQA